MLSPRKTTNPSGQLQLTPPTPPDTTAITRELAPLPPASSWHIFYVVRSQAKAKSAPDMAVASSALEGPSRLPPLRIESPCIVVSCACVVFKTRRCFDDSQPIISERGAAPVANWVFPPPFASLYTLSAEGLCMRASALAYKVAVCWR
ncbi:hypothetical protein V495_05017 [Pseudogymnoascus sp. VKM F-4514 (FW-929)]|nr:hypothetical protein V495_05017 [Pseudogymnoascus sp. VKM F-4514 (FW-929)]KFY51388.1 hypothetical protein V497_09154 [Pseudogymnoascus sp. VKM F-4516 (FW-969)]